MCVINPEIPTYIPDVYKLSSYLAKKTMCFRYKEQPDMFFMEIIFYRGVDKSLARPGRKQARKHVRYVRDFNNIETLAVIKFSFFCKARRRRKFTPF